jgi:hypothetical protein
MTIVNVTDVASVLYADAYEASYGGKERGRFLVSRDDLKKLLGVTRLHHLKIQELTDACLALGLVVIDMDDVFAFAELQFVNKWRKLPSRLVSEYADELTIDGIEDDDSSDSNEENDE